MEGTLYSLHDSSSSCSSDDDGPDIYIPPVFIPPDNVAVSQPENSVTYDGSSTSTPNTERGPNDDNNETKPRIRDSIEEHSKPITDTCSNGSWKFNRSEKSDDVQQDNETDNGITQEMKLDKQGRFSSFLDHQSFDKEEKNTLLHCSEPVDRTGLDTAEEAGDIRMSHGITSQADEITEGTDQPQHAIHEAEDVCTSHGGSTQSEEITEEGNKDETELQRISSLEQAPSDGMPQGSTEMGYGSASDGHQGAASYNQVQPNYPTGTPPPLMPYTGNPFVRPPWNMYCHPGINAPLHGAYFPNRPPYPSAGYPWGIMDQQRMAFEPHIQPSDSQERRRDHNHQDLAKEQKENILEGEITETDRNEGDDQQLSPQDDSETTETEAQEDGSTIVITFTGDISAGTLYYYFDNPKKSGGGEIENLDISSETGLAVIRFKNKEAAKNVLKKGASHTIANVDLTIHVIESDHDLCNVIEERMVFVKGIYPTTSEDCLRDYMEVRADSEPTQIVYGADRSNALLSFEDKVDFGRLERASKKRPLEGNILSVYRVPVTRCILVTNIGQEITRDTVQYYFENKRKSGGDDEAEIINNVSSRRAENASSTGINRVDFYGTSCVIRFPTPQVAKRVCAKEHVIGKVPLNVCLYHSFLGNQASSLDLLEEEVFSTDAYILKYMESSPGVKGEFEHGLSKLNGQVIWPKDLENNDVRIKCSLDLSSAEGQIKVKTWKSEISSFTEKFKSSMKVMKMTTIDACWKDVKMELKSIQISDPEKLGVFLEKDSCAIVVVGEIYAVDDLCQNIKTIILNTEQKIQKSSNSSTKTITFRIFKLQLLWLLKSFDEVAAKFPDVAAECDLEKKEVRLTGPNDSMQEAELFLREKANSFECKPFKLSKYKKELLSKKASRDIWYSECRTKQIRATWSIDRDHVRCEMYALTKKEADCAIICMEDLFLEDEFLVEDQYEKFIKSSGWKELLKKLEKRDEMCFAIHTDNRKIQMAAQKYIFHEIKSDIEDEIDNFLKLHGKMAVVVPCDKGVHMFLSHFGQRSLQDIEKMMKKADVKICGNDKDFSFQITGKRTAVSKAKSEMKNLISKIHSDKFKLEWFGSREFFASPRGKKDSIVIGKKNSCVVLHETEYSEVKAKRALSAKEQELYSKEAGKGPSGKPQEFAHDDDHKIIVVQADITKLEVDVIVNAANNDLDHCGGLAKAVVDAAGRSVQEECKEYIKKNGKVQDGDAMTSKSGKLPCKMIIHAVGPMWQGGSCGEEKLLEAAVQQCLYLTEQDGYHSVAIPALSGGIFGYPLDKCTMVIVQTIKDYFTQYGSDTSVEQVYLCDVGVDVIQKFKAALTRVYSDGKNAGLAPLKYPGSDTSPTEGATLAYPHHTEPKYLEYPSKHHPSIDRDQTDRERDGSPSENNPSKRYTPKDRVHQNRKRDHSPPRHQSPRGRSQESRDDSPAVADSESQGFFRVIKGLLTERQVDAIVNSINQNMDLNHGRLSKSILQAAGDIIQTELYNHIDTFKPCQTIAVTSGGSLPCKCIFHGVLIPFDGTSGDGVKVLQAFLLFCMMKATELGLSTIAFPAVGTGVLGYPADVVAKIMFETIQDFQNKCPQSTIKYVEFVIYPKDTAALNAFQDRLKKVSGKTDPVQDIKPHGGSKSSGGVKPTQLGGVNVLITCGDITKESTGAIVNSISHSLDLSKGAVSKAIVAAGGPEIQEELTQEGGAARSKGLIVTSGGRLKCKHIFHILAHSSSSGWESAVTKCLDEAEKRRLGSLSLPALGTAMKVGSASDVAYAMFQAIKKFPPTHHLKQVTVVVFQKEMATDFIKALKKTAGISRNYKNSQEWTRPRVPAGEDKPDRVTFYLWSDSKANISDTKRDLQKLMESQSCQKSVSDYSKVVNQLHSNDEIFKEAERKFHVKIEVLRGEISIEGPQANVNKAYDQIKTQLRQKEGQMYDYERAKDVAKYVQWYYQSAQDKTFRPFKVEDNFKIENEYKNKKPFVTITDRKGVSYKIDFKNMTETASDNPSVKIPVKRDNKERPRGQVDLPSTWSKVKHQQLCHEEEVFSGSKEYDRVKMEFQKSGGTGTIVKIFRVQNPTLYLQYAAKKKELWNKNKKNPERWLWHGTSADTVNHIINHGFNRSYCGKNGTAYGQGVYFAVNASYSVGYSQGGGGVCHMFSAQVLTGEACHGSSGMRVLPARSGNLMFDSASDNPSNPVMFIIFHDSQAYPTYHILFQ